MTQHKNVYSALAAAQQEMGAALKSANNPHFKSKYADLSSVIDACGDALNRNGIAYFSVTDTSDKGWVQRTTLAHGESETFIACDVPLIVGKNDMQGFGSAVTYARRYGLMALAGIAPEDDDGNAAAKSPPRDENRDAVTAREAKENTDAAQLIHEIGECQSIDEIGSLWTAANRDHRKVLLTRRDVADAKDKAKARVAEPDPFAQAAE